MGVSVLLVWKLMKGVCGMGIGRSYTEDTEPDPKAKRTFDNGGQSIEITILVLLCALCVSSVLSV